MTLNKQLINLIGLVVTVAVLVAGVALAALPMYSQSQTIDSSARAVAGTNAVYEQQVAQLTEAEGRIIEIDADLASLRAQIAASPRLDDVQEIVALAAQRLDVRVESVTVDEPAPWVPRDALDDEGNAVATTEPEPDAASEPAAEGGAGTAAAAPETAAPAAPPVADELAPQRQVLATITVDVSQPYAVAAAADGDETADGDAPAAEPTVEERLARARKAVTFVDDLGRGPRLLAPIDVDYTDGKLTIAALAFIRTEDPS